MLIFGLLSGSLLFGKEPYDRFEILTAYTANYSRDKDWQPGDGLALEVGGMCWTHDGRLAVTIRKGEVWLLSGVDGDQVEEVEYQLYASGLHEPLGIIQDGKDFLVSQRSEVTRLVDRDGDDVADQYLTVGSGWNVSGSYHGYIYGPERDGQGNIWVTTNVDMGDHADNDAAWRGWGLTLNSDGGVTAQACGMRSPSGLGANLAGDMFYSDQQGVGMPSTPIYHLRHGMFYGNTQGLASTQRPDSPMRLSAEIPDSVPLPEAFSALPEFSPPAVWLPYNKVGRSATDIQVIDQNGQFGPFDGQLLIGEFTNAEINRVFLEKVNGEYQGACFKFIEGLPSAVFRLAFGPDGSLYVGMTNRGWSSLGNRAYGLMRLRWNGESIFEVKAMRAQPDGFELEFTEPVDRRTASNPASYKMINYTYLYSQKYGSDEIQTEPNLVRSATVSEDGLKVQLEIDGMRPYFVHELDVSGVVNQLGKPLLHPMAYYTLNSIPKQ